MGTTSLMTELSPSSVTDQIGGWWGESKSCLGQGLPTVRPSGLRLGHPATASAQPLHALTQPGARGLAPL